MKPEATARSACRPGTSRLEGVQHVVGQRCIEVFWDLEDAPIDAEAAARTPANGNDLRNRLSGFRNHDLLARGNTAEEARELCLRFVGVYFHEDRLDQDHDFVKGAFVGECRICDEIDLPHHHEAGTRTCTRPSTNVIVNSMLWPPWMYSPCRVMSWARARGGGRTHAESRSAPRGRVYGNLTVQQRIAASARLPRRCSSTHRLFDVLPARLRTGTLSGTSRGTRPHR